MDSESHSKEYVGSFISPRVMHAWETGELLGDQILLLHLIHALSRRETGCTASNEYLRQKYAGGDCTIRNIQKVIQLLIERGWVRRRTVRGQRRLVSTAKMHEAIPETPKKIVKTKAVVPMGAKPVTEAGCEARHFGFAKRLRDAIVAAGAKLPRKNPGRELDYKKWAREFVAIEKLDKRDPEEVKRVLVWYCKTITDPFAPQAWSGRSFRAKYAAIFRQYEMRTSTSGGGTQEGSEKSEEVKQIEAWDEWGGREVRGVAAALKDARTVGSVILTVLEENCEKHTRLGCFASHLLKDWPSDFAVEWMREYAKYVSEWDAWSGMLPKSVLQDKLLRNKILKASMEFSNSNDVGKKLLAVIEERMSR